MYRIKLYSINKTDLHSYGNAYYRSTVVGKNPLLMSIKRLNKKLSSRIECVFEGCLLYDFKKHAIQFAFIMSFMFKSPQGCECKIRPFFAILPDFKLIDRILSSTIKFVSFKLSEVFVKDSRVSSQCLKTTTQKLLDVFDSCCKHFALCTLFSFLRNEITILIAVGI